MMWLLDTNIVSHILRGSPIGRSYQRRIGARAMGVSWMTIGELLEGAYRAGWDRDDRLSRLEGHINQFYTLVPMDIEVYRIWAQIRAARRNNPVATDDALIAATAVRFDAPLVTHNPADFEGTGARVVTLLT